MFEHDDELHSIGRELRRILGDNPLPQGNFGLALVSMAEMLDFLRTVPAGV